MPVGLEELIVQIGADVTDLKKGLLESEKGFDNFEKKAKKSTKEADNAIDNMAAKAVTSLKQQAVAFASVTTAVLLFQNAMSNTAALGRLAQQTGIAVSRLSELQIAAQQAGIEFQVIEQAVRGFTQRLAEGLSTVLSPVSVALSSLGVSARDSSGQVRNFADILPDIADAFANYADGVQKAQVATALFGEEAGPRLIPLLNRGRAGIADLIAEARKLGVVTDDQVKQANEYEIATGRMVASIQALVREFSIRLGPAIVVVADAITKLISLLPKAATVQQGTEGSVDRLTEAIRRQEMAVNSTAEAIARQERLRGQASQSDRDAHERAKIILEDLKNQLAAEQALLAIRQSGYTSPAPPSLPDQAAARLAAAEAMQQAQFELGQLQERLQGQRTIFDDINFQWRSHAEIVSEATEKINRAYEHQGDRRRALAQLEANLNRQNQQQMLDTASLAASTLTALFPQQKGAAIAAAVINTAVGITRALSTLLPPWNWIQAGLIAASGAAQIATIRATSESGGPTPSVGSGGGAAAAQAAAAPVGADTGGRSLSITGIDPAAIFTGRIVGSLIEAINNEVQNGATLITTRLKPT